MDDLLRFGALGFLLLLTGFVLGAGVMWSVGARRLGVQPTWFVLLRWLTFIGWAGYGFLGNPAPTGTVTIDPGWWMLLGVFAIGAGVLGLVIELGTASSGGRRGAA